MKKAVMYGAGNIGRGFIGQLFSQSGYEVVFLDISETVIDRLNRDQCYPLRFVSADTQYEISVANVRGVNAQSTAQAAGEIADAAIMATAVGANILPHIAPVIAKGLTLRWQAGNEHPLNILICENLISADALLRKLLLEQLDSAYHNTFDARVGLVETSIGRMVPVTTPAMQEGNPARVWAEAYDELPADREGFRGDIPDIVGLKPFAPFHFYIERKLYMHNMSHAILAYMGYQSQCEFIWQALRNHDILDHAIQALDEVSLAISQKYAVPLESLNAFSKDLIRRFDNPTLGDTTARVGRDPIRKLAPGDRLVGAADLCLSQNVTPVHVCSGIAAALFFDAADDPAAQEIHKVVSMHGTQEALARYANISPENPLFSLIQPFLG